MGKSVNGYRKERQRLFCQGHASKKRFYKKVLDNWEEDNIGTDDEMFIVTIKQGYSFSAEEHQSTRIYPSAQAAMSDIHNIYRCECPACKSHTA